MHHTLPICKLHSVKHFLPRSTLPIVGTCAVAFLLFTLPLCALLPIWFDEAYSLHTSSGSFSHTWSQAIGFEEQAPIYFLLLTGWRTVGDSVFWARLFSVLCVLTNIWVAPKLGQRYASVLGPAAEPNGSMFSLEQSLMTILIALSPWSIWAATEIRLYALSTLISSILLLTFHDAYLDDSQSRMRCRVQYILSATIAIYTHYMLAPLIIAQGITLLVLRRNSFLNYLCDMCIVTIAFAPFFPTFANQLLVETADKPDHAVANASAAERLLSGAVRSFGILCYHAVPADEGRQWIAIRVGVIALLLPCVAVFRSSISRKQLVLWTTTATLTLLFAVIFAFVNLSSRHACSMFVPTLLSVVAVLNLPQSVVMRRKLGMVGLTLFLLFAGICLAQRYTPLTKDGDTQRVASFIENLEQPEQPILVFDPSVEMVLSHYYDGANRLVAVPMPEDFKKFSVDELVLTDETQLLAALPDNTLEFWLVNDDGVLVEIRDFDESFEILERFVARHCEVIRDEHFHGSRVRLLQHRK